MFFTNKIVIQITGLLIALHACSLKSKKSIHVSETEVFDEKGLGKRHNHRTPKFGLEKVAPLQREDLKRDLRLKT